MQREILPQYQLSTQETEQLYSQGNILTEAETSDDDWAVQLLDSRRAGLEIYLQSLASIDPLPSELLEFLDLQDIRINQQKMTSGNVSGLSTSRTFIKVFTDEFETPVFQILTDYKEVRSDDNNDIIIQSALQAFYAEGME